MPIKSSSAGSLGMDEINAEFALGNNLNTYRSKTWYNNTLYTKGSFSPGSITFNDFYAKSKSPNLDANIVGSFAYGGTAATVTIPAAAAIGDFAILWDASSNTSGSGISLAAAPAGWTRLGFDNYNPGTNAWAYQLCYKKLVSGDPGKVLTLTTNGGAEMSNGKFCVVYRISRPILSITATLGGFDRGPVAVGTVKTCTTSQANGLTSIPIACFWDIALNIGTNPITLSGWQDANLYGNGAYWDYRMYTASVGLFEPPPNITGTIASSSHLVGHAWFVINT